MAFLYGWWPSPKKENWQKIRVLIGRKEASRYNKPLKKIARGSEGKKEKHLKRKRMGRENLLKSKKFFCFGGGGVLVVWGGGVVFLVGRVDLILAGGQNKKDSLN